MTTKTIIRGSLLTLFILSGGAYPALALNQNCRWTGNGANNKWSTAANWDMCGNGVPGFGDSIIFINTAKQGINVNDLNGLILNGVGIVGQPGDGTPANPLATWNITGNPISVTNGITG